MRAIAFACALALVTPAAVVAAEGHRVLIFRFHSFTQTPALAGAHHVLIEGDYTDVVVIPYCGRIGPGPIGHVGLARVENWPPGSGIGPTAGEERFGMICYDAEAWSVHASPTLTGGSFLFDAAVADAPGTMFDVWGVPS